MKYIILTIILMTSSFASANENIDTLFNTNNLEHIGSPAKNTFIIWINGDADRFRPVTSSEESKIIRIDNIDRQKIQSFTKNSNTNVVLFIDQRGSGTWYKSRKAWRAHLWVYSNGKLIKRIKERKASHAEKSILNTDYITYKDDSASVDEVNQANHNFLTSLLNFSQELFPTTDLHFIYRGHSFASPYTPGNKLIAPFDYSDPESSYNIDTFLSSIENANLNKKLSTVTFASCSMAYASMAFNLSDYAEYMVASQVNILETSTTGFNFSFIKNVNDSQSTEDILKNISSNLLSNFLTTTNNTEYIRETPLSIINLNKLSNYKQNWRDSIEEIKSLAHKNLQVTTSISSRYILKRKSNGLPESIIKKMVKAFSSIRVHNSFDLISTLDTSKLSNLKKLKKGIKNSIFTHGTSPYSKNTGLSFYSKLID